MGAWGGRDQFPAVVGGGWSLVTQAGCLHRVRGQQVRERGRPKVPNRVSGEEGWVGPQEGPEYRLGQRGAGCAGADGNLHRGGV